MIPDLAAVRCWENESTLRNVRSSVGSGEHPSAAGLAFPLANVPECPPETGRHKAALLGGPALMSPAFACHDLVR